MKYAIVDIETNGGVKITEISIFIFDGNRVVDEYTTLVNPESYIPPFITGLTGITNAMVSDAPKFYEVAKKVLEITEATIFVAHSVNFDYSIIQKEFKELGASFKRKKLCTVRLSRKLIPGLKSYSLGKLCATQGITINGRHRARGDAEATTILFDKLLKLDNNGNVFASFLKPNSGHATIPPLLSKKVVDELPKKEGVYYFRNEQNEIIYVGKANNIKQRVLSHFYDKAKKEIAMCMQTANITYEETGSELLALLLESSEIKRVYPKYNRAQRRTNESIAIFSYEDRNGIIHLASNKVKLIPDPLIKFYNTTECRVFMERLCEEFELCPKYCHLQTNIESCFHFQIKKCKGICRGKESVDNYNIRVQQAINSVRFNVNNFIIKEKGRSEKEFAFVLVLNGTYKGFGYLKKSKKTITIDDYLKSLTPLKDNKDVNRILNAYLKKNEEAAIVLENEFVNSSKIEYVLSNQIN